MCWKTPLRGYKISKACTKSLKNVGSIKFPCTYKPIFFFTYSACGKTLLQAYQYQQCSIVPLHSEAKTSTLSAPAYHTSAASMSSWQKGEKETAQFWTPSLGLTPWGSRKLSKMNQWRRAEIFFLGVHSPAERRMLLPATAILPLSYSRWNWHQSTLKKWIHVWGQMVPLSLLTYYSLFFFVLFQNKKNPLEGWQLNRWGSQNNFRICLIQNYWIHTSFEPMVFKHFIIGISRCGTPIDGSWKQFHTMRVTQGEKSFQQIRPGCCQQQLAGSHDDNLNKTELCFPIEKHMFGKHEI